MPRLRVLLVAAVPPPYGGQEVLARTWLQSSLSRVCTLSHIRSNVQSRVRLKGRITAAPMARFAGVLLRMFLAMVFDRPDVMLSYVTATRSGFVRDCLIAAIAWMFRVKVMWHYPGDVFRRFVERSSPRFQRLIRSVLHRIAGVMVVSEGLRAEFAGLLPPGKLHVLSTSTVLPEAPPAKASDGPLRVMYVGWISYVKGFYDLICALGRGPRNVQFDIVGELIGRDMAASMARRFLFGAQLRRYEENEDRIQSAIEEAVGSRSKAGWTHYGTVSESRKHALLEGAHVLVIPSYADSFPLVALEAMSRGCAVIVSRAGAMAEYVSDGQEGYVVDAGDSEAIADRLSRLSADPSLCRRMGQSGRRLVKERFDIEVQVPHLLSILESARRG